MLGQHISSSQVGTFIAIVGLPWTIQFIWGPLIDRYQYSVIGHRKHWVVLAQLMAAAASLGLLLVDNPVKQLSLLGVVFCVHSIFASIQDASVDAIAISIVPANERGRINAVMRGGFLMGVAAGSGVLSVVLHHYGFRFAAITQTSVLLFFTLLTICIKLDRHDRILPWRQRNNTPAVTNDERNPSVAWLFKEIYRGMFLRSSRWTFLLIALVYLCFSLFIRSFIYSLIHDLHWPDERVSLLQGGWGVAMTVVAVLIGGLVADRVGFYRLQIIMVGIISILMIGGAIITFLPATHGALSSVLVGWSAADPLFSVAACPILMGLCLPQVEGSQFTTYMAMINFCDVAGSYLCGWALQVISASSLQLFCGIVLFAVVVTILVNRPVIQGHQR